LKEIVFDVRPLVQCVSHFLKCEIPAYFMAKDLGTLKN
jgi:hypothetical protein